MRIKYILIATLLSAASVAQAVDNTLPEEALAQQQSQLNQLKKQVRTSRAEINRLNTQLKRQQQENNQRVKQLDATLESRPQQQDASAQQQNRTLSDIDKKLENVATAQQQSKRDTTSTLNALENRHQLLAREVSQRNLTLTLVLGAFILIALSGYLLLLRRVKSVQNGASAGLQQALERVGLAEQQMVKADHQLADSLTEVVSRMTLLAGAESSKAAAVEQPDHTLPLKVADEIFRMRKRLASLPTETKGLTPLKKSLERLENQLNEQGYEIIDYTGMDFDEGMTINARVIPSDDLEPGKSVITKVVAPQINHNGLINRIADVEVSVG